ncbi:MAG: hypothetical protein WCI17_07955 [bacterium]
MKTAILLFVLLALLQLAGFCAGPPQLAPEVPARAVDIILGRPTGTSVVLSVLGDIDTTAVVAYGTAKASLSRRVSNVALLKGQPCEILLEKLMPDTAYGYQLLNGSAEKLLGEGTFHTARLPGRAYTFTVTADSHLDGNTDPALYQRTLASARSDAPDFHIDLGDTFMTGKHASRENATRPGIRWPACSRTTTPGSGAMRSSWC